tara:strand:+ start:1870 stop:2046 length:177 start_codon:yes stop_codon:yes gene_type:complete
MSKNNQANRAILINKVISNWDNDQLKSYVVSSLQRWYKESNIDFDLDWSKEFKTKAEV